MSWTVFGLVYGVDGRPVPGTRLLFRPAEGRARGWVTGVRQGGDLRIDASPTGYFTTTLTPGKHFVWIGPSRRIAFVMPDEPGQYFFPDLLGIEGASPSVGGNYQITAGLIQLVSATDGTYRTIAIGGEPSARTIIVGPAGIAAGSPNYRYRDGMLELADFGAGTWHAPHLYNGAFRIAEHAAAASVVDRIAGGLWQLKDLLTGTFRTWFITGPPGEERIAFGPATT